MAAIDPLTRRSIDLFLARVRPRYDIREVLLYGSRARGDAREDSDVDLALVIEGDARSTFAIVADMNDAAYDALSDTGRFIAPLPIKSDLWRDPSQHSNPYLLANIRREGVAL